MSKKRHCPSSSLLFSYFSFRSVNKFTGACWIKAHCGGFFWAIIRLKFPITSFSLCSQLNIALETRSLMPLISSKFEGTSSLTEVVANYPIVLWQGSCLHLFVWSYAQVNRWKSYFLHICVQMLWWVWPRWRFFR